MGVIYYMKLSVQYRLDYQKGRGAQQAQPADKLKI